MEQEQVQYELDQEEYIDVKAVVVSYFRYFRRRWFLLLFWVILCTAAVLGAKKYVYTPSYYMSISYSVDRVSDVYTDATIASRIAKGVSTIANTADFKRELQEAAGEEKAIGGYYVEAWPTESANLFTVGITCSNPETIKDVVEAFEKVFPEWVSKSMGNCTLTVTDESEISASEEYGWFSKKYALAGVFAGIMIWLFFATWKIGRVRKIYSDVELYELPEAECLGILPEVKKKKRKNSQKESLLMSGRHVESEYVQSVRALRNILELRGLVDKKVIMMTSTVPEEGKTLITLNLAYALANRGKKVTVIDADLYQCGVTKIINPSEKIRGLSNYLTMDGKKVLDVVMKDKIDIVTAGTVEYTAGLLLRGDALEKLVKKLKADSDVVLIDTPPVDSVGDALVISGVADAVLYVIRSDFAEIKDIRKGIEPFYNTRKLEGYILNRVTKFNRGSGSRYGRRNRYYYGYRASQGYADYRYGSEMIKELETKEIEEE